MIPEQASTIAGPIDNLYAYLIAFSVVATLVIIVLIVTFSIRYRARPDREQAHIDRESRLLEATWVVIPFIVIMVAFGWGAKLFVEISVAPEDADEIHVVGKQWMWHVRHPEGRREINELHVPKGQPIRLTITSEDVIHSFYVPALRVKQDAVPDRFTSLWFEATKTGEYHLFCAEFCGTDHARMRGRVVVMEPTEYENWLASSDDPLASAGERLFREKRCIECHSGDPEATGPDLLSRYGKEVELAGEDESVRFDRNHLRQSVLDPASDVARGYEPVMPTYRGRLTDREILELAAYLEASSEER